MAASIDESLRRIQERNRWCPSSAPTPDRPTPTPGRNGINVVGDLQGRSGLGSAARGYVRALRWLGVPTAIEDLSAPSPVRAAAPHDVNLLCVNPEEHFAAIARLGDRFFEARYNIGAWMWELPRVPDAWHAHLAYYDEMWVGTSFIANALAPVSPIPVVRIPPVLTPEGDGSRDRGRRRLGLGPDEHAFLFVIDFRSHAERKNPRGVIEAFRAAFAPSDPVRLVIKCMHGASDPETLAALCAQAQGHAVTIRDESWPALEMRDLVAACDAYVSLHRAEGLGLTLAEAMSLGKPVIATGWSGNMDFMSVSNSFPVRYELVPLAANVGPFPAGEVWAEPSIEHAAELMRWVLEHPEESRARGQAAKRDVDAGGSERAVGRLVRNRLQVAADRSRWSGFRAAMTAFFHGYQGLTRRIREIARQTVPPGARVIVVSRGDPDLLELDGRPAWHFPRTESGAYAGHYPADSAAAIAHLEALRAQGGEFFLLPGTALWWLEHYTELRAHLEARYHRVWADDGCVIYRLSGRPTSGT